MMDCFYRDKKGYGDIKTVLTIHNIEFQGRMDQSCITDVFGIPESHRNIVEYDRNANMLKAGIELAHAVTTVSRNLRQGRLWTRISLAGLRISCKKKL